MPANLTPEYKDAEAAFRKARDPRERLERLRDLRSPYDAQTDALAKLLIEKGLITREEFMQKIAEERAVYRKLLNPTPQ
jgi:hypothetical protein